jgi:hypothetical protein
VAKVKETSAFPLGLNNLLEGALHLSPFKIPAFNLAYLMPLHENGDGLEDNS